MTLGCYDSANVLAQSSLCITLLLAFVIGVIAVFAFRVIG